jgi:hypothetical protein
MEKSISNLQHRWPNGSQTNIDENRISNLGLVSERKSSIHTRYRQTLELVKSEIDSGHPFILDSRPGALTQYGHFIAVVGYSEEFGNKEIIAYDPFGQWTGTQWCKGCTKNYYLNV